MKFYQRFAYYMIGFVVGMGFLFFIFNAKDTRCNYMPNKRVLNDLSQKPFLYSDAASVILAQPWVDTIDIKNTLKFGDVDFSRSNVPYQNGKLYVVEGKTMQQQPLELKVVNYHNRAVLIDIVKINP
jgi:hypothetical protein